MPIDPNIVFRQKTIGDFMNENELMNLKRRESAQDFGKIAENSFWKKIMGAPVSPEEDKMAEAFDLKNQKTYFDSETGDRVTTPSLLGRLGQLPVTGGQYTDELNVPDLSLSQVEQLVAGEKMSPIEVAGPPNPMQNDPVYQHLQARQGRASELGAPQAVQNDPLYQDIQSNLSAGVPDNSTNRKAISNAQIDVNKKAQELGLTNSASIDKTVQENSIPGMSTVPGAVPSADDAKKIKDVYSAYETINGSLDQLHKVLAKDPNPIAGSIAAKNVEQIKGQITIQLKALETMGALDEGVQAAADRLTGNPVLYGGGLGAFAKNPIEATTSTFSKITQPKNLNRQNEQNSRSYLDRRLENSAKASGYDASAVIKQQARSRLKQLGMTDQEIDAELSK